MVAVDQENLARILLTSNFSHNNFITDKNMQKMHGSPDKQGRQEKNAGVAVVL